MKSIASFFNNFLKDEVNLNPTRLKVAKNGIKTMKRFLKRNELFKKNIISITPQGSYRQETINKPSNDADFDVDLLVLLEEFEGWEAKDYLSKLHQEFKNTDMYKDIVDRRGKSRCVTIDYASDFHIDLVPAIEKNGGYKIMNKNSNEFEDTDGEGYANWFQAKNDITTNKFLTKTVRLVKYLRDYKGTFSIKSVVLTTLLGKQVYELDKFYQDVYYKDLPTTLKTLFNRLNSYLQSRPNLIDEIITNPVLPTEKYSRHWNQEKYSNFRQKVCDYNTWINEAYEENDINKAVIKWRKVFGDEFGEIQESTARFSDSGRDIVSSKQDKEEFIFNYYQDELDNDYKLVLCVSPRQSSSGFRPFHYRKNESLTFFVDKNQSLLPPDVVFKWKVKNSGLEAKLVNQLRGNIEDDISGVGRKIESTSYKGKHYVDCYAVRGNTVIATDTINITVV
jgi:hypothetical protein